MTALHNYLARLQSTIASRREIEVEEIEIRDNSDESDELSRFRAKLRFYDHSRLEALEDLLEEYYKIAKKHYSYHYQDENGNLIFRYDNAPHHPEISTHPHHKHAKDKILPAQSPDLSQVLKEIDEIIYKVE